jgi:hypothetical protein
MMEGVLTKAHGVLREAEKKLALFYVEVAEASTVDQCLAQ